MCGENIYRGIFFLIDVFTAQSVPKKRSIQNATSGALPLVIDFGCGYVYVTG